MVVKRMKMIVEWIDCHMRNPRKRFFTMSVVDFIFCFWVFDLTIVTGFIAGKRKRKARRLRVPILVVEIH